MAVARLTALNGAILNDEKLNAILDSFKYSTLYSVGKGANR